MVWIKMNVCSLSCSCFFPQWFLTAFFNRAIRSGFGLKVRGGEENFEPEETICIGSLSSRHWELTNFWTDLILWCFDFGKTRSSDRSSHSRMIKSLAQLRWAICYSKRFSTPSIKSQYKDGEKRDSQSRITNFFFSKRIDFNQFKLMKIAQLWTSIKAW